MHASCISLQAAHDHWVAAESLVRTYAQNTRGRSGCAVTRLFHDPRPARTSDPHVHPIPWIEDRLQMATGSFLFFGPVGRLSVLDSSSSPDRDAGRASLRSGGIRSTAGAQPVVARPGRPAGYLMQTRMQAVSSSPRASSGAHTGRIRRMP